MLQLQDSSDHSCVSVVDMKQRSVAVANKPRRSVSFAKTHTEIEEVGRRCSLSDYDKTVTWYSKDDYRKMKKEYSETVKKMAKSLPLGPDEEARGLDHKTPRGGKKRLKTIFMVIDTLLDAQERQFEDNRRDPNYLAEIYRQASAHCLAAAYATAKEDESYVQEHVIPGTLPLSYETSECLEVLQQTDSSEWDQISLEDEVSDTDVSETDVSVSSLSCPTLNKLRLRNPIVATA